MKDQSVSQEPVAAVSHDRLRLTANQIPLIAPFMGQKDIRYYMNGINVKPHKDGGAILCATNGCVIGLVYDRDAVCDHEVTLSIDARTLTACAGSPASKRQLTMLNGRLAVVADGEEICIQAGSPVINCKYPIYSNVIPEESTLRPGLAGTYNATYLATLERAAKANLRRGGDKTELSGVTFFNVDGDPNRCTVARLFKNNDFLAVLMPTRSEQLTVAIPLWVGSIAKVDDLAGMAA